MAHALDGAADDLTGSAAAALREAADLRRAVEEDPRRRAHRPPAPGDLVRPAPAGGGEGAPLPLALPAAGGHRPARDRRGWNERIAEHVAALSRAYTAAGAAKAAALSLDDAALRTVQTTGQALEEVSQAIVDQG